MIQKIIYTIFVGILLAVFVGIGIKAFYPSPTYPKYPTELNYPAPGNSFTAEQDQLRKDFDTKQTSYDKQQKNHSRNVAILLLISSILFLIGGMTLQPQLGIIADGFLLGGVITLLHAVTRSFMAQDMKIEFIVVSVGLLVAIILGYVKFVHPEKHSARQ